MTGGYKMPKLQTTGFNADTAKNLLLDAGAVYKNFDKETYTGTLIGATQGGNSFSAAPTMRNIPVDGVKSEHVKGLTVIDAWVVSLTTNLLEVTKDTLTIALGVVEETEHDQDYDSIRGKNYIGENDYLDNVAFVGKISGSGKPVIIIVENALNHEGLQLAMQDAGEGVLPVTLFGHMASDDLDNPPFEILYPKGVENTATLDIVTVSKEAAEDIKFTVISSGNAKCIGVKLKIYSLKSSEYEILDNTITVKKEYLETLEEGEHVFTLVMDQGNNVTAPKLTITA